MKLREFNFKELSVPYLSIYVEGKQIEFGFIGEVLRKIPHLADYEIKDINYYFECFIIRL
jgi:hypothetical protein